MMEDLKALCQGEEGDGRRQIFTEKPHSTWDNFFSGDDINDWIGQGGFGVTMTCQHKTDFRKAFQIIIYTK